MNSTALMILLREKGMPFEAIFADTGCEWPETYEHIARLKEAGWPITTVRGSEGGIENIYDYGLRYRILPSVWNRWCTTKFKTKPIYAYTETPAVMYLGIDAGEEHRAKPSRQKGIEYGFPLIEWGIGRQGCIEIIKKTGMAVPPKSGCWLCPFQRTGQVRLLRDVHPELYCKVKILEDLCVQRRAEKGKPPFYLYDRPLDEIVQEDQMEMFGFRKPCTCGL